MKTKNKTEKYDIRNKKDIEILKAFLYQAMYGDMFQIHIYDKITKKVYAGAIGLSSYKKEEVK